MCFAGFLVKGFAWWLSWVPFVLLSFLYITQLAGALSFVNASTLERFAILALTSRSSRTMTHCLRCTMSLVSLISQDDEVDVNGLT